MKPGFARAFAATLLLLSAKAAFAQNDLSVTAITQPVSGCALAATENVTIHVFNFGTTLPAGSSFNVSYTVNAGAPVTELVVLGSSLLSNSTLTYTFTTQANLSVPGTYTFAATVSLAGDINPANDAFTGYLVANTAPSVGGTLGGGSGICPNAFGVLTLSGQTGSVVRWETSTDGGATWVNISNTTTTQSYANVAVPTLYRVLVQNGSCTPQHSSIASVSPAMASPVITVSADVCPGQTGNVASVLDAGPGAIYSWAIAGGTITSGAGTRAITFTAGSGTGSLTVTVQTPAGCTGSAGASVSLRTPAVSIVLHGAACVGATGLRADIVPGLGDGAIYFWTISNGLITAGLGTHSITYEPTGTAPVALEALVAQSGCLQDVLATVPVSVCTNPRSFFPLPPCRAIDTRGLAGFLGGPTLAPGEERVFPISLSSCGLAPNAAAVAVNVTTIASVAGGLAVGAGDLPAPAIDSIPLSAGKTRAVQAIARLAADGSGTIVVRNDSAGPVDLVVDVTGTFK